MQCSKCDESVLTDSQTLQCVICSGNFHLSCLSDVTETEYDFLKSSNTWKCSFCLCKKSKRDDETPVTPSSQKALPFSKENESGSDSSSASAATGSVKASCFTCAKGFSHNAHRARCVKCSKVFHFKSGCLSITKDDYVKVKSTWVCHICNDMKTGDGKSFSAAAPLPFDLATDKTGEASLSLLLTEMRAFRADVNLKHSDLQDNMNKYSEWVVEQGKKIDEINKQLTVISDDITSIRQENVNLKKCVRELTEKVNLLEQSAKDNVLEIYGVPYTKNENLIEVIGKVSNAIGFDFDEKMVDNCYRYRSNETASRGIVVKFVRKLDMERFVKKRKEKRNLNSRDLGFMDGLSNPVYVNGSLTKWKRQLLNSARKAKSEKHYTYLWVSSGRILMRKNEGDRPVVINSEEDIAKLA